MVALQSSLLRAPSAVSVRANGNRQTGLVTRRPLFSTTRVSATGNELGKYYMSEVLSG